MTFDYGDIEFEEWRDKFEKEISKRMERQRSKEKIKESSH